MSRRLEGDFYLIWIWYPANSEVTNLSANIFVSSYVVRFVNLAKKIKLCSVVSAAVAFIATAVGIKDQRRSLFFMKDTKGVDSAGGSFFVGDTESIEYCLPRKGDLTISPLV